MLGFSSLTTQLQCMIKVNRLSVHFCHQNCEKKKNMKNMDRFSRDFLKHSMFAETDTEKLFYNGE